mmetsp:Transcript_18584/g.43059  ORF Transcript_18584/g.43059 Transcript_18584/m.43059 type:complete len:142 (+) Transcript_18584:1795-2220(+)
MWSVGVILYVLLVGYPPFMEDNQQELFRKIRMGEWEFYQEDWANVSPAAMDLIKGLLVVDPKQRMNVDEALRSKWILESEHALATVDLTVSLQHIKEKRHRLRHFAHAVMWTTNAVDSKVVPREIYETVDSQDTHMSDLNH